MPHASHIVPAAVVLLILAGCSSDTGGQSDDELPLNEEGKGEDAGASQAGRGGEVGDAAGAGQAGGESQGGGAGQSSGGSQAGGQGVGGGQGGGIGSVGGAGGKAKFHVFLMIGQSNMEGYGVLEDEDFVAPARVLKMSPTKTWLPGNEGTNISRQNRKRGEVGTSMGRTFAMELLNNESDPEVKIGLINVAVGGSSIQSWQDPPPDPPAGRTPYDANYAKMLPFLREALKTGVLKGVLWHQGEANGGGGESYEAYLRKLISNLRAEVNDPNLPFMLGQVGLETETRGVNLSLANVAMSDPRVGLATNEGLTMKPGENNPHYDARSQREYGRRYARIYRSLTAAP